MPLETATPATLTLNALPGGLPVGSHATHVLLSSAEATNAPLAIPVTLTVTRPGAIEGHVHDPAGKPIAGAVVTLRGERGRQGATVVAGS